MRRRPMYGCPENFRESLTTPTATFTDIFPKFLMGFCTVRMDPLNVLAKFEIRSFPVPEIIGGTRKNWAVPGYAHAPVSLNFLMGFWSDGPSEYTGFSRS